MKKLFVCALTLLLTLPVCAGAETTSDPTLTQARGQGDGYAIAYDATAFSFYLDGVAEGVDLLVPTQDAISPVYLQISHLENAQDAMDDLAGEGYADAGEITLASGLRARTFTLTRSGVDYACYIVEGEGRAYSLLTVCSQAAEEYAQKLRAVTDTFTLTQTQTPQETAVAA